MGSWKNALARVGVVLFLTFPPSPYAKPESVAGTLYNDAVAAMRAENYSAAEGLFERARRAGLDTAALHYNSGVVFYKLGRYPQAKSAFMAFKKSGGNPALAHFNLGLTTYRMGQYREARNWLKLAVADSSNPRLSEMATEMLATVEGAEKGMASVAEAESPWALAADLKWGVDDNLTLENSELGQATRLKDSYFDLYAAARYQLSGDRGEGIWGQLSAASQQYRQYPLYDYGQYDVGLFKASAYGLLATGVGLRFSHSTVGGGSYLQKYTLRLQGDYAHRPTQRLRLRYDISRYDPTDNRYGYIAGLKGNLNIEGSWYVGVRRYRVGYDWENSSRDDDLSGNNFTSYSAARHEISASVAQKVAGNLQLTVGGDYRQSRYHDADVSAGVTGLRREDERWRWMLTAEYRLTRYLDLVAEYHYSDNDSNLSASRYRQNQYLLGLQGNF